MKTAFIVIVTLILLLGIGGFVVSKILLKVPAIKLSDKMDRAQKIEALDQWLTDLNERQKFNGVVLLIVNDQIILEKGYGYTDYTQTEQLTLQSSMRLASVSKQFTAAGIMALHDQGKLNLDDEVSAHIDGFPYEGVSIRHLLNQTSGVPDNYFALGKANIKPGSFLTLAKATELIIAKNAPAISVPNAKQSYSNTNYMLLARIAELVSGQSFENYMQSAIFTPMGMKNTRVWTAVSPDKTFPNKTEGFTLFNAKKPKPVELTVIDGVAGDGSVFSSIEDFKIWNKFWTENPIISQETLAQAFKAPTLNDGSKSDYGFGWILTDRGNWHNGGWLAARSFIARQEEKGIVLVVVDNSLRFNINSIIAELTKAARSLNER